MKHTLLAFVCVLFLHTSLSAQITLNSGSYPASVIGTDSLKVTTAATAFPSLTAMDSGMWDMSVVTDSTPVLFAYRVSPDSSVYQFADSNLYNFGSFGYQGNLQSSITSSGLMEYGIRVPKTGYSLTSLTAGPIDSFIINAQYILYTAPRTIVAFPATIGSSWTSNYHADLDFKFTYVAGGYTDAPGITRRYTTEKDSVTGWGLMRIKNASGAPSQYEEVLQVETVITHTDSFFLNGLLFPGALLTFFNITEGEKDTSYQQNYYRTQEVTPFAQVSFHDAAYTQPYTATTHVQRLVFPSAVAAIAKESDVKVYPNPVEGSNIFIELPAISGPWSYALMDINGRKMAKGLLQVNGNNSQIEKPESMIPGTYYLELDNNGKPFCVKEINVSR